MPLEKDQLIAKDEETMISFCQIMAIVIQKALSKITDKMVKGIELTDIDKVTIYEITLTLYVVINQCKNFNFCDYDIVKLHIKHEKILLAGGPEYKNVVKINNPYLDEDLKPDGPWRYKCGYMGFDSKENLKSNLRPEDYQVEVVTLRRKRTLQQKIVEQMVLKLFSKQSIFSLVDILFGDMYEDSKNLLDPSDSDEGDEEVESQSDHEATKWNGDKLSIDLSESEYGEEELEEIDDNLQIPKLSSQLKRQNLIVD